MSDGITADRLRIVRPDIYPDAKCARCEAVETQAHVWECQGGITATSVVESTREWVFARLVDKCQDVSRVPHVQDVLPLVGMQASDVVRGICPAMWVGQFVEAGLATADARRLAVKAVERVVSGAREQIWKARCKARVQREKELGITASRMRRVRQGAGGKRDDYTESSGW